VPEERTCTILDLAAPTCGFNPLAVDASPDTIADYVVAAMRNLLDEGDIRASSDRYLRNAVIAVLAYDRHATLWDAVRLLSVTEEGYAYRRRVGEALRGLPEFEEIGDFFTEELRAQLHDAKAMTTSKLDAPVNKAARLLNSPSIKRVLQNTSLTVDFDRILACHEVLVVKGALGRVGTGNTSVLMQLLMGMLDAALARQQDDRSPGERTAVALKIDEAPLVINRGFAQTMALKRSAGLETVACWQADAQWVDPEVRPQLDALFAHRVYFATASAEDAGATSELIAPRPGDGRRREAHELLALGGPGVRLHLPKHQAIVGWVTPEGRQPAFVAQTFPVAVDPERIAWHTRRQYERGGRELETFRQPHWDSPAYTPRYPFDFVAERTRRIARLSERTTTAGQRWFALRCAAAGGRRVCRARRGPAERSGAASMPPSDTGAAHRRSLNRRRLVTAAQRRAPAVGHDASTPGSAAAGVDGPQWVCHDRHKIPPHSIRGRERWRPAPAESSLWPTALRVRRSSSTRCGSGHSRDRARSRC
jgi:hypothetical protein